MDITALTAIAGNSTYFILAGFACYGAYCVMIILRRVSQKRFRSEEDQTEFLDALEEPLSAGDFDAAAELLEGDRRAVCQLGQMAIANRGLGYDKIQKAVGERFQRDVLADLEYRLSWVNTVIKSAPMVGLLGTVLGMMGAFGKLASAENVKASELAEDISLALVTTACGLVIAIPLIVCVTLVTVRIRMMEDISASGLSRFLEQFRRGLRRSGAK